MKKSTKNKSVTLSVVKVKTFLAERNIFTLKTFEISYEQFNGNEDGAYDGTPRKVWSGTKVAFSKAREIAHYFGLENELPLLPDQQSSWETLVYNSDREAFFMTFYAKDPGQLSLALFEGCGENEPEIIDQHKIRVKCHLMLEGARGDHYFILLRTNNSHFEVFAPVNMRKNCDNRHTGKTLRFPQGKASFSFDPDEGKGFRELIAIRIPQPIPFNRRSENTGRKVSLEALNRLTTSLMLNQSLINKIAVARYQFMLV